MSSRRDAKVAQENAEYEAYQLAVAEEARLNAEAEARQMAALNTVLGVFKQVVKTQLIVSVVGFRTNVAQAKRRAVAEEARLNAEEEAKLKAEVETRRKAEADARRALEAAEKRIAKEEACRAAAEAEAAKAALLDEMERRAEEAELCRRAAVQTTIIKRQQDKVAAAKEKQAEKRSAVTVKQTLSLWHVLMCIALVCVVMFMYSDNALTTSNVAPAAKTSEDSHVADTNKAHVPDTRKADVVDFNMRVIEAKNKHEAEEKATTAALLEKAKLKAEMDLLVEKGIEESKVHDAEELYLHLNAATSNLNVVNKQVKVYEDEITKEEAKFALIPRKESQIAVVNDNDRVAKNRKADKSTNERYMIEDEASHSGGGDTPTKKAKAKVANEKAVKDQANVTDAKKAANDAKSWQSIKTCGVSAIGIGISAAFWNVPGMYASAGLCVGHTAYTEASK